MSKFTPVIIINYRQPQNTLEALHSIYENEDHTRFKPVVVDVSQNDSWLQKIPSAWGDWITHLPLNKNLGFSGANNYGWQYALETWHPQDVILLNDDTKIGSQAFSKLIEVLHSQDKVAAVVPKIYFYPGHEFYQRYQQKEQGRVIWYGGGVIDWPEVHGFHWAADEVDRGQLDILTETDFATGCCLALKAKALQDKPIFDDRYFLYLEDLELSQRLLNSGWQIKINPQSEVWHKNAGSSGSGSDLHLYYQTRNRYLFGFTYAPWRTKLFLLKNLIQQYRQKNPVVQMAIKDFILGKYGYRSQVHH